MTSTTGSPEPETWRSKPENTPPKQAASCGPLRDARIRLIMIPAFGVAIPHLTGYFGPHRPGVGLYWVGLAWSMLISFTLWHGNRFFLLKQRQYFDWFSHPVRKIILLLFANVFYTAPVTVLMMLAWFGIGGFGPDWNTVRTVTLACVICVIFITHVYETVYLIQQRESDLVAFERMERARAEAELEALKGQVAPHFLFNALNTLSWLIENDSARALRFNQDLAEVYRYILIARRRDLVPLAEECDFLGQYCRLLGLRFEDAIVLDAQDPGARAGTWFVPPTSLQLLAENAVKHNEHSPRHPLRIAVSFDDGRRIVTVANQRRPRAGEAPPTPGLGLRSLDGRCRLVLGRGIEVAQQPGRFSVQVPAKVI